VTSGGLLDGIVGSENIRSHGASTLQAACPRPLGGGRVWVALELDLKASGIQLDGSRSELWDA
jgi:hypothetical protein